jgi:hypothetical protein
MTILLQPLADSVVGDWTNEAGGSPLFSSIAGESSNDATFIRSPDNPVGSRCRIKLSAAGGDLTAPATLYCRMMRAGDSPLGGAAYIYEGGGDNLEGGTLIASLVESDAGEEFFTFDHELTTEQFEAVTDWDDLYIEFEAGLVLLLLWPAGVWDDSLTWDDAANWNDAA